MSADAFGGSRRYSKEKTARMMAKVAQTIRAMKDQEIAQRAHRAHDPFERARLALQRRGIVVFAHSVHKPGSDLFVVGQRLMSKEAVCDHAARFCKGGE